MTRLCDNLTINLNGMTYFRLDAYQRLERTNTQLNTRILELEGIIENLKSGTNLKRFYVHSEPALFHYNYYSIDAESDKDAKTKFFEYLDSTVSDIYPTQRHVDAEKQNTSIHETPFGDSEYTHIE